MSNNETSRLHLVIMEEETNNKGKKISASACITHFLSFEAVSSLSLTRPITFAHSFE